MTKKNGSVIIKNGPVSIKNGPVRIKNGPVRIKSQMRQFAYTSITNPFWVPTKNKILSMLKSIIPRDIPKHGFLTQNRCFHETVPFFFY